MEKCLMNTFWGVGKSEYEKYLDRLNEHVKELSNMREKSYRVGLGTIKAIRYDRLENPNGKNKWHGWKKVGEVYRVEVYDKDGYLAEKCEFTNKDEANEYFITAKRTCLSFVEEPMFK